MTTIRHWYESLRLSLLLPCKWHINVCSFALCGLKIIRMFMIHTNELESISHFSPLDECYQFLELFPDFFSPSSRKDEAKNSRSWKDKVLFIFMTCLSIELELEPWNGIANGYKLLGIFRHYHSACDIFCFRNSFCFWNAEKITCTVWNHHLKLNQSCVQTFNFSSLGNTINFNISKFPFSLLVMHFGSGLSTVYDNKTLLNIVYVVSCWVRGFQLNS